MLVAIGLVGAAGTLPLPLVRLRPGAGIELVETVDIVGEQTPINGDYRGLTIRLDTVTPLEWLQVKLTRSPDELVDRDEVFPPNIDRSDYDEKQRLVYADSARVAAAVAQRALGLDVTITGNGVRITSVAPGSAAEGRVAVDDVVVAVAPADERSTPTPVTLASGLRPALDAAAAASNGAVRITIRPAGTAAGGATRTIDVTLAPIPGTDRIGLGVTGESAELTIDLPVEVEVEEGQVGGPSAGLLTALLVYDALAGEDLSAGRRITGTGTLDVDGTVGPIGGIVEKARGALDARADVFIAPAQQVEEARAVIGDRMVVLGVGTFDEALTALRATASPSAGSNAAAAAVTPPTS